MSILNNQNDNILQNANYRFVSPSIELSSFTNNSMTTTIIPKFTKLTDVAALSPSLVVISSTATNVIGTTASLPTPTQYYWEYSTTTNPNTWTGLSPQPTYGVGYAVGTLQVTNVLFKTHVGTGNTGVYYRLTLQYAVEDDVVGPATLISYVAESNTYPTVELSKPIVFIPTTTTTVDFSTSAFDINVRVGNTYLLYDGGATPAINTFKVGTPVIRVGTTTIGAMTLTDTGKAIAAGNDTASFANFSGVGTTNFVLLDYPITVTDIDNKTLSIVVQQTLTKQLSGQDGTPGALFEITNSAPIFRKNSSGVFSPASLTLNTQFLYITGTPSYQWYKNNVAISGATSSSYTVATADYASVNTNTYKCIITGTIGGNAGSTLNDEVTIPVLADGSNAIQISNSNENITFSGPETGFSGISFTSGGSVIRVYLGTTLLSYAASGANTFSATIANTGVTVAAGTGTGTTFTIPAPTAMSTDTATTVVTVTVRDSEGAVTTPTTTISYSLSRAGAAGVGTSGTRTAILEMYIWSATTPTTFPIGTSTYTWSTGQFTAPATLNSWSLTPPASVVGQTLWVCRTVYADTLSTTTTSITWSATAAYAVGAAGTDGVNGTRTAFLELYRWSTATPTTWPTGNSTYTWATGVFTAPATLNSWALVPGASTPGFNLYATSVRYSDTGVTATSTVTWPTTGQVAYVVGSAGSDGADSTVAGPAGNSSRRAYARIAYPTTPTNPVSASITTTGSTSFPGGGAWGVSFTTTWTASDPNTASTDTLYQCDGIYNPATNQTIWTTPYISALKVGTLSAITVDAGTLTAGSLTGLTVTGGTIRTGTGTSRVEMSAASNDLKIYVGGVVAASIGTGTGSAGTGRLNVLGSTVGGYAIQGTNTGGAGVYGEATTGEGVVGRATTSGIGVNGYCNGLGQGITANNTSTGIGLKVTNTGTGNAAEITGNATGIALKVTSTTTGGIEATATSGIAIKGTTSTGNGVTGTATGAAGNGITAQATTGYGVYSLNSSSGIGIYALANGVVGTGTNHALRAQNSTRGTQGLVGGSTLFDFYAEGTATNYGPFTGAHDTLILKSTLVEAGDILVDVKVVGKWTLSNVICESAVSTQPNQKAAIGVFVGKVNIMGESFPNGVNNLDAWELNSIIDTYDYCAMNALGEGQVNVCGENGNIEMGDLIVTSSMLGKGMRQADDIVRSYTVAKAREAVTFSSPNEVKTIACIYLCG